METPDQIMNEKENSKELVESELFTGNTSAVNICLLYSLMIKRIAKGYSSADVSFLMGYKNDVVQKKEHLTDFSFGIPIIHRYLHALEKEGLDGIIFNDLNKGFADYQMTKTISQEIIQYELFEVLEDKSLVRVFLLFEENHDYKAIKYSNSYDTATNEATIILNLLFDGSYFLDPRTPLAIYNRCRSIAGSTLTPMQVRNILQMMIKKRDYPKLQLVNDKDRGCIYEKSFAKI